MAPTALHLRAIPWSIEDLDLPLDNASPSTVTTLLARGVARGDGTPVDASLLWALDVQTRTECLLRIAALEGSSTFELRLRCHAPACGKPLEIELTLDELLTQRGDWDAPIVAEFGGVRRSLRAPTGEDQRSWSGRAFDDVREAGLAIATSLLDDSSTTSLSDADVTVIERLLAEHDPLVDFTVLAACPYCGAEEEYEVDLLEHAIKRLRDARDRLLAEIQMLAASFHWSESEIVAIPAWRRSRYLALNERATRGGG
ncbi:MAG TPA: hypothetical protein VGJ18_10320 [Gemmatimonadaceae bacterium]|jgi:hypothetical protein